MADTFLILSLTWPTAVNGALIGGTAASPEISLSTAHLLTALKSGKAVIARQCTAALFSDRWILTGAHCYGNTYEETQSRPVLKRANFGISAKTPEVAMDYTDIFVNPKFDGKNVNDTQDVALARLPEAVPSPFGPAPLMLDSSNLRVRDVLVGAGYGITDDTAEAERLQIGQGTLRMREFRVLTLDLSPHDFAIRQSGGGMCHGDSGGPLYKASKGRLYIAGVLSRFVDVDKGTGLSSPNDCRTDAAITFLGKLSTFFSEAAAIYPELNQILNLQSK